MLDCVRRLAISGAAAASVGFATPTWGSQAPAPSVPDDRPVVVTGQRLDGPPIFIDAKMVANSCAECRRALAELRQAGKKAKGRLAELSSEAGALQETFGREVQVKVASTEEPTAAAEQQNWRAREIRKPVEREMGQVQAPIAQQVASYFRQIEAELRRIAPELQANHRAPTVYIGNVETKPQIEVVDVTAEAIRIMDQSDFRIDLRGSESPAQ